jgi:serine/threonine-protein kinase
MGLLLRRLGAGVAARCGGRSLTLNGRRYRLLQQLHRGVNSTLHLAADDAGSRCVLKRPLRCFDDEDEALFEDEYRVLSACAHPNIVRAIDYGIDPATREPALTMEYVAGTRLDQAIRALSERDVACAFAVCLAVCDYLSRRGVAHCDLKPDNILVRRDGALCITDFGVATRLGEPMKGHSPAFVAPEHACGAETPVGPATDLYAVGVTFYWLLTGRHPHDNSRPQRHSDTAPTPPAAPTTLNSTLDPRWDEWLPGLVARDPAWRIRTAAATRAALAQE